MASALTNRNARPPHLIYNPPELSPAFRVINMKSTSEDQILISWCLPLLSPSLSLILIRGPPFASVQQPERPPSFLPLFLRRDHDPRIKQAGEGGNACGIRRRCCGGVPGKWYRLFAPRGNCVPWEQDATFSLHSKFLCGKRVISFIGSSIFDRWK